MPPDVGKYTMVCQNIGPAVAGSAGPVPPPLVDCPWLCSRPHFCYALCAASHCTFALSAPLLFCGINSFWSL